MSLFKFFPFPIFNGFFSCKLCSLFLSRANLSEVEMRHEMAIHLAIEYPKMRKRLLKRTDMPWVSKPCFIASRTLERND